MLSIVNRYYLLLLTLLVICSCSTNREMGRENNSSKYANELKLIEELSTPPSEEMTARLRINVAGLAFDGQLRMRWNESLQISITALGVMELFRVEALPEMVVIIDRRNGEYAVGHYADLPYRNITGIDFYTLQSILWSRLFVVGYTEPIEMLHHIKRLSNRDALLLLQEGEYNYQFLVDNTNKILSTSKSGIGYGVRINYSDYKMVNLDVTHPTTYSIDVNIPGREYSCVVRLSNISVAKGNWPNQTAISSRYKYNTLKSYFERE